MERVRESIFTHLPLVLSLALLMFLAACVQPVAETGVVPAPKVEVAPAPAPILVPVPEPPPVVKAPVAPYEATLEKMTVAECGRCHTSYYNAIRDAGGRHKFDCQDCHQQFHSYNPNRNNWAQIMPKCSSCHTLPHGPKQTECLACHANPHTPLNVVMSDRLTKNCADCHTSPDAQLKQFPSKHTEQGCSACHDKHGYIPSCFVCHEGHYQEQPLESCTSCHPVHKPLQIAFKGEVELKTCSGCHSSVYGVWAGSKSKHATVSCVSCHTQHGLIPSCNDCHGPTPHNAALHTKFPNCLTCHIDPHDPPVKTR